MEQKIQELTNKIYQEGVEKGEQRARQLVSEAETKAAGILAEAKAQAEKILLEAQNQAAELKRNTEAELKLSGAQAVSAVKQQLLDMITAQVIEGGPSGALSDPSTVKELIQSVLKNWKPMMEPRQLLKFCFLPKNSRSLPLHSRKVLLISLKRV